eukprot:TRINITY_DN3285_c0_g1_i1.p1 TRINITY_DN3285_c0_g1~~TRINITY_DN3285_c0_g1_i1.p1  ORF type:complete len:259 (+),score=59.32 TRINITY_DN3285_c0_g1_i1:95-778(+)
MGDILDDSEAEVNEICDEVENELKTLPKMKDQKKKNETIAKLKSRMNRAKTALRSFKVELRELSKLEARPYQEKATKMEERINQLIADIDWAEKQTGEDDVAKQQTNAQDYKSILNQGNEIQQDDLSRLANMSRDLSQTQETGANTLLEMSKQRDQMTQIRKGVEEVESNIKMANKQLRVFARRIATDKIIMGFIFLIVAAIIFIIIYSVLKPKAKTNIPSDWRKNS